MKRRYRIMLSIFAVMILCTAGWLILIRREINQGIEKWSVVARTAYPESVDDITAMLTFLQSDEHSLNDRNHMIWAIGQSRNAEALPILGTYYTGQECNHSESLCQYELEKAIRLCDR